MKRLILSLAICCMTLGCSPSLTIKPDGTMTAVNYTVVKPDFAATPNPWFSTQFLSDLFNAFFKAIPVNPPAQAK